MIIRNRFVFIIVLLLPMSALAQAEVVFLVRHAEKASTGGNDPDLSPDGQKRAEALAQMLKDAGIGAIFATELKRTQQTAEPIARATHVSPTIVAAQDITGIVEKLRSLKGNALVVAHGNTIPDLVRALGIVTAVSIPDTDYSELFLIIRMDKPQLLRLHYSF